MVDDRDGKNSRISPLAPTQPEPDDPTVLTAAVQDTTGPAPKVAAPPLVLPDAKYHIGEMIGRGGMGEVLAAHDQHIGREVAIKRMRTATPDGEQLARFLREARIQARLDHPAIVPVHELGTDESGRPFFSMKRVSGVTLAEQIAAGAPQQRLLRAFVDVCHSSGSASCSAHGRSR